MKMVVSTSIVTLLDILQREVLKPAKAAVLSTELGKALGVEGQEQLEEFIYIHQNNYCMSIVATVLSLANSRPIDGIQVELDSILEEIVTILNDMDSCFADDAIEVFNGSVSSEDAAELGSDTVQAILLELELSFTNDGLLWEETLLRCVEETENLLKAWGAVTVSMDYEALLTSSYGGHLFLIDYNDVALVHELVADTDNWYEILDDVSEYLEEMWDAGGFITVNDEYVRYPTRGSDYFNDIALNKGDSIKIYVCGDNQ